MSLPAEARAVRVRMADAMMTWPDWRRAVVVVDDARTHGGQTVRARLPAKPKRGGDQFKAMLAPQNAR